MGIINCTPDSFYSGSRSPGRDEALSRAEEMIAAGADILDLGGESTRPGARAVESEEQIRRVVPVIRAIREISGITLSIDTRSAEVAAAALDAGADLINDISALADPEMAPLAAERQVPIVLMHMQGNPENMQKNPNYNDVVGEVRRALEKSAERAVLAGIRRENLIFDPGIGFGKRQQDNLALLARIPRWRPPGAGILIGLSRKSFLGRILESEDNNGTDGGRDPEDRLVASIAAHAWCLQFNVDILRVHDVTETRQLLAVWEALSWAS